MNFNEYQTAAMRTSTHADETQEQSLVHASLGISTEAGEFTTDVKRIHRYKKPMSDEMRDHMAEELGDLLWYVALGCQALGVPMGVVATSNIGKLMRRFPEKYTNDAAEARADKGGLDAHTS